MLAALERFGRQRLAGAPAWLWLMPTITLALFIVAMATLLWLLFRHEQELQRNNLARDIQWAERSIVKQLDKDREFIDALAHDKAAGRLSREAFENRAAQYLKQNQALLDMVWNDVKLNMLWSAPAGKSPRELWRDRATFSELQRMLRLTSATGRPTYTNIYSGYDRRYYIEYHSPIIAGDDFLGTISAVYSLDGITQYMLPPGFADKYGISVADREGDVLLSRAPDQELNELLSQSIALTLPWRGLTLRATSYKTESPLAQNMIVALIFALCLGIVWSLWLLARHIKKRVEVEAERDRFYSLSLDLVCIIGMDGMLKRVNPAFQRILGFSRDDLLATPFLDFVHPDDRTASELAVERLTRERQTVYFENRCRAADGQYKWLSWSANPAKEQGLIFAVANDITVRKQAELALKESHERFVTVLDGLDVSIYVADLDTGELLFANEHFHKSFPDQDIGTLIDEFERSFDPPPNQRFPKQLLLDENGEPAGVPKDELQNRNNGHWYMMRSRALRWVDARMVRMQTMGDITERKLAEEMTRQQHEKLLLTSRLMTVGEMASTLAHELNQPLAAIVNYNMGCVRRLQAGGWREEDLLQAMQKASVQAERAGKIIQRVRDFVRKREPNRAGMNVNEIIDDVTRLVEIEAEKEGVRIQLDLDDSMPPVLADRIMIEQVVLNLVKNGIESMRETEMARRQLTIVTRARDVGGAEIAVADRGHGIAKEVEQSLFSPFFTTKAHGMGMGLNICRSIVEFHDGRLWFTPNLNGGSVFRFTLPTEN